MQDKPRVYRYIRKHESNPGPQETWGYYPETQVRGLLGLKDSSQPEQEGKDEII